HGTRGRCQARGNELGSFPAGGGDSGFLHDDKTEGVPGLWRSISSLAPALVNHRGGCFVASPLADAAVPNDVGTRDAGPERVIERVKPLIFSAFDIDTTHDNPLAASQSGGRRVPESSVLCGDRSPYSDSRRGARSASHAVVSTGECS